MEHFEITAPCANCGEVQHWSFEESETDSCMFCGHVADSGQFLEQKEKESSV